MNEAAGLNDYEIQPICHHHAKGGIFSLSTFHRHQIDLSSVQFINYNCDLRIHYFCFHHRFKLVWMRQCARILGVIIQSISKIKHLNILMLYLWTLEHITRKRTYAAHLVLWFDVMSFWSACERLLFVLSIMNTPSVCWPQANVDLYLANLHLQG